MVHFPHSTPTAKPEHDFKIPKYIALTLMKD